MSAKLEPIAANNNLVMPKLAVKGINKQVMVIKPSAINIALLYPILVIYDETKKETIAMLRSLNASKTEAAPSVTEKLFCTCRITVPTLFNKIAKTK